MVCCKAPSAGLKWTLVNAAERCLRMEFRKEHPRGNRFKRRLKRISSKKPFLKKTLQRKGIAVFSQQLTFYTNPKEGFAKQKK